MDRRRSPPTLLTRILLEVFIRLVWNRLSNPLRYLPEEYSKRLLDTNLPPFVVYNVLLPSLWFKRSTFTTRFCSFHFKFVVFVFEDVGLMCLSSIRRKRY